MHFLFLFFLKALRFFVFLTDEFNEFTTLQSNLGENDNLKNVQKDNFDFDTDLENNMVVLGMGICLMLGAWLD